jgi:hypothetical protein
VGCWLLDLCPCLLNRFARTLSAALPPDVNCCTLATNNANSRLKTSTAKGKLLVCTSSLHNAVHAAQQPCYISHSTGCCQSDRTLARSTCSSPLPVSVWPCSYPAGQSAACTRSHATAAMSCESHATAAMGCGATASAAGCVPSSWKSSCGRHHLCSAASSMHRSASMCVAGVR